MQKSPQFNIWDSLSARQMRWWCTRRSIHCFWSVTKPCLSALVRKEKLLESYTGPYGFYYAITNRLHCPEITAMPGFGFTHSLIKGVMGHILRVIHCFWSVAKPCFSNLVRKDKLLEAHTCLLRVIIGRYCLTSPSKNRHNARFGIHSQPVKLGEWVQLEQSIAYEVWQNLAWVHW